MVLTTFDGVGVGLGFGIGCGFGIGWGFGGMPLHTFGMGIGEAVEWDLVLVGALAVHLVVNIGPPKSVSKALNLITRG